MRNFVFIFLFLISVVKAETGENFVDANPIQGDVILPMPCDAKMVFRKVYTSYSKDTNPFFSFEDGLKDTKYLRAEGPYTCAVRGDFSDKKGHYFLIAKYELMEFQFQALKNYQKTNGKCTPLKTVINKTTRRAKVNISYNEATELAESYSNFLQTQKETPFVKDNNGRIHKAITKITGSCEWSFAARGGLEVSKSTLESKIPFSDIYDNVNDFAWISGDRGSNGKIQVTGLKKPNPLGIYDIYGNAAEMMQENFRERFEGKEVGPYGGIVIRGGSIYSTKSGIYSAARAERALRTVDGTPNASKDLGVRFILTVPATFIVNASEPYSDSDEGPYHIYIFIVAIISSLFLIAIFIKRKSLKEADPKEHISLPLESPSTGIAEIETKPSVQSSKPKPKILSPRSCRLGYPFKIKVANIPPNAKVFFKENKQITLLSGQCAIATETGKTEFIIKITDSLIKKINYVELNVYINNEFICTLISKEIIVKNPSSKSNSVVHIPANRDQLLNLINDERIKLSDISIENITDLHKLFVFSTRKDFSGINRWDVSHVENMSFMFMRVSNFNEDLSGWTPRKLKNASHMFYHAASFNSNLDSWQLSSETDMTSMFTGSKLEGREPSWYRNTNCQLTPIETEEKIKQLSSKELEQLVKRICETIEIISYEKLNDDFKKRGMYFDNKFEYLKKRFSYKVTDSLIRQLLKENE